MTKDKHQPEKGEIKPDAEEDFLHHYERIAASIPDDRPKNAGQALSSFLDRAEVIARNYRPTGAISFKATPREPK